MEEAGSFCRDPGQDQLWPWCYTMNPSKEWDYCHIENLYCGEFPVIWNGKKCDINLFDLFFFHFQIEASIQ